VWTIRRPENARAYREDDENREVKAAGEIDIDPAAVRTFARDIKSPWKPRVPAVFAAIEEMPFHR
jgi:hypothetical protein